MRQPRPRWTSAPEEVVKAAGGSAKGALREHNRGSWRPKRDGVLQFLPGEDLGAHARPLGGDRCDRTALGGSDPRGCPGVKRGRAYA